MYAELVINIEAPLKGVFHYSVPRDLEMVLQIGHLVEVDFGNRLAQGIVVEFSETAPVEEVKPVIGLIDPDPVIYPWQIELARWLSDFYLSPLNACVRLILPPGLTRWADITLDINPYWDGSGQLTETQRWLVDLLGERGALRGRQIARARPKGSIHKDWRNSASQLVRRSILRRASVLDPPRIRPKQIRTAELVASQKRIVAALLSLGRASKAADILHFLLTAPDPLPQESLVMSATGASSKHLESLISSGIVHRSAVKAIAYEAGDAGQKAADLSEGERALLERLPLPVDETTAPVLESLQKLGWVKILEQEATISLIALEKDVVKAIFHLRKAQKYEAVIDFLAESAQPAPVSEVYEVAGASLSHLRKLAALELIKLGEEEVWRDPLADRDFVPSEPPDLTTDQAAVWMEIKEAMAATSEREDDSTSDQRKDVQTRDSSAFLLYGVTGSGKTEVYMKAVDYALRQGRSAIILVPEIALTPQTVRRFAARFPGQVAVLHSRLSDGERFDTWRRARLGKFDIIIGPRSAIFTPLHNIGVIVVDEEHDDSYKQTPPVPPPYYHAREAAVELGRIHKAAVILGSATPDIVSYHEAKEGGYKLLSLPRRIMGHRQRILSQEQRLKLASLYVQAEEDPHQAMHIPLPPVEVVDLRQELRAGNRTIFSRILQEKISSVLSKGEQAMLFLNRRGTSTFIFCRDCGLVVKCPRCDSPLTYHRPGAKLVCHYCGRKEEPMEICPRCGSHRIRYFGLGTEEVERRVQERWPQARTVRWDRDTTAGKDTHEALLTSFINRESDILVGTQMIAKGLDLPLVTLVGVISADVTLGLPDFATGERAFQLLAQVAGRAGRGLLGGEVILQTYQPDHYAIQAAAGHDYERFFVEEMRFRSRQGLPPFRRLAKISIADPINARAEREAKRIAGQLSLFIQERQLRSTELYGPIPPFFSRLDGRYRWQIVIRSPDPRTLLRDFQLPAKWVLDIDPVSTL